MRAVAIHETITSSVIVRRMEVVSPNAVRAHACFSGSCRITSRATSNGKARNRSVARIRKSSNLPPLKPAKAPMRVPMMAAEMATATPMNSDTRPPQRISEYMSRPIESVPNQYVGLRRQEVDALGPRVADELGLAVGSDPRGEQHRRVMMSSTMLPVTAAL